ncbi:UNVERIFIED_CONTAM: hypothetical protein RMT77_014915 [Armadillidium vulgare]
MNFQIFGVFVLCLIGSVLAETDILYEDTQELVDYEGRTYPIDPYAPPVHQPSYGPPPSKGYGKGGVAKGSNVFNLGVAKGYGGYPSH